MGNFPWKLYMYPWSANLNPNPNPNPIHVSMLRILEICAISRVRYVISRSQKCVPVSRLRYTTAQSRDAQLCCVRILGASSWITLRSSGRYRSMLMLDADDLVALFSPDLLVGSIPSLAFGKALAAELLNSRR